MRRPPRRRRRRPGGTCGPPDLAPARGPARPHRSAAQRPVPGPADHKYTRGVVGVVAGAAAYPGAAVLTVAGALGAGCGMVRYVGPDAVRHMVVAAHPEVVTRASTEVQVQAWVIGPGVSDDDEQSGRARAALAHAVEHGLPVVVDAGGLELLPGHLNPRVVLTP